VGGETNSQWKGARSRPLKLCEAKGSLQQGTAGHGFPDWAVVGRYWAVGPRLETPNGGCSRAPIASLMVRHRRASIRFLASTHDGEHPTHHSHHFGTHTSISHPNQRSCSSFSSPSSFTSTVAW